MITSFRHTTYIGLTLLQWITFIQVIQADPPSSTGDVSSTGDSSSSTGPSSSTASDASSSSSSTGTVDIRSSDDSDWGPLTIFLLIVGIVLGIVCLERFYASCKRTYQRRQGRDTEGFSELQLSQLEPDGGISGLHPSVAATSARAPPLTSGSVGDHTFEIGDVEGDEDELQLSGFDTQAMKDAGAAGHHEHDDELHDEHI